ncbi:MAG TPA: glycosyl hydrolase, partial [Luteolibacter sp.]|nr:glycosyl hydrolase [Luteolibacter sp.]
WLHGDENETRERLEFYLVKVAGGGNGCFTAESRPHRDWLGPGWYRDLDICLQRAKALDLKMWIFDEKWWPSQSIGGTVPADKAAKTLVADLMPVSGPAIYQGEGYSGPAIIATVAGRLNDKDQVELDSLLDLSGSIRDGRLNWQPPAGRWAIIRFSYKTAPGLGQTSGKELSVDGASRDCTEWFINKVYQPHHDRFKDDFGKTIVGFFYDEPETRGDWGTEVPVVLAEWGVDWKKAYVAHTCPCAGEDAAAARYQYLEALAEAWGRVMYGGMTRWCEERGVESIGHFMEHGNLHVNPRYCAGDMMRLQKYSSMGGIDLVCNQMHPGQRPHKIYQTPKLGSSVSHVYGKKDDLAMCEIYGGYGQKLGYPEMKWLADQHQLRGINLLIPHSFNPKAPNDRDYPPYFYNGGMEPRWPLYRVWADYTNRLSLMLTGGHHVCPVAILFSGNAGHVGAYETPENLTTALQDARYDADWLPFERFTSDATRINKGDLALHGERYRVLVVPPTEVIPREVLAKAATFLESGGVVIGYGRLPVISGTVGCSNASIADIRTRIWGTDPQPGVKTCKNHPSGGRSYFLPLAPDAAMLRSVLNDDAGIRPLVDVVSGDAGQWLHVLHRVKDGRDIYLICNQDHLGPKRTLGLSFGAQGVPEIWDPMRNRVESVPFTRDNGETRLEITLEPMESVLVVFNSSKRPLPKRLVEADLAAAKSVALTGAADASGWSGTCQLTESPATQRHVLVLDGLGAEQAARVRVNGQEAGGLIGKPYQLDISRWLKPGENRVEIAPFAPESVSLRVVPDAL